MNQEAKLCEKCSQNFVIQADDFAMYEKMDLPLPTMCSTCRFKYLLAFWVFGRFRITKSALSGKTIITVFPESVPFPLYDRTEFVSDAWDPLTYGRIYDESRSFIEQVVELQSVVPHPHQTGTKNVNCDWTDDAWESKDAYLTRSALHLEHVLYGYRILACKNSVDVAMSWDLERSYDCLYCFKSYNLKYSFDSRDCMDSSFLYDCRNCQNCFMCWNLRNQKYCILNQPYSKEEYENKLKEYNLKSYTVVSDLKKEFWRHISQDAVHRQDYNLRAVRSAGNFLNNDKNCNQCYFIEDAENSRYCFRGRCKETIDSVGVLDVEKSALEMQTNYDYNCFCNMYTNNCRFGGYMDICEECEYCFGCVGLRKKKYCILNKQYAESEYKELLKKIKSDMKKRGEWGKFFPLSSAYCGYNFSLGQIMYPLSEKEAVKLGFKWEKASEPHYENIINADTLPDTINEVKDDIVKQRILCPETKLSYNITKDELAFYKEHGIPLPRRHFDWRTLDRFKPFSSMIIRQNGTCCYCKKEIEYYYGQELGFKKIACLECYQREVA
jgi:hypothetical protein